MNSGCRASDGDGRMIEEGVEKEVVGVGRKLINIPWCMDRMCNDKYKCICCVITLPFHCWSGPDAMTICNRECAPNRAS